MSTPISPKLVFPSHDQQVTVKGINLHEYAAVHALQGVIAAAGNIPLTSERAAEKAMEYATALMRKFALLETPLPAPPPASGSAPRPE